MSDDKNDSKKCLLKAAARLFSSCGLEKTSTRELAKESKSNISLISYYFGGKEGLYKEVLKEFALKVENQVDDIMEDFQSRPMNKETFIHEMNAIANHMISLRFEHPEISKILSREKIEGMPFSRQIHEEIFYPQVKKFYLLFEAAQKAKIVDPEVNPTVLFLMFSEGIWGFYEMMDCKTSLRNDCEEFVTDIEKIKQQILKIYLNGVLL